MPARSTSWRRADVLAERGIEVLRVERGGEVTYHGPGPAGRLSHRPTGRARPPAPAVRAGPRGGHGRHRGVVGRRGGWPTGFPGCWVDQRSPRPPRKLGALGLRVERGVTYHGIAFNVTTDLAASPSSTRAACRTSRSRPSHENSAGAGPTPRRRPRASRLPPCGSRPRSSRASRRQPPSRSPDDPRPVERQTRPAPDRRDPRPDRRDPRPGRLTSRAGRPLRAAARRHHRLVGRGRRRPRVRPPPFRPARETGRRPRRRLPELPPRAGGRRLGADPQAARLHRRRQRARGPRARDEGGTTRPRRPAKGDAIGSREPGDEPRPHRRRGLMEHDRRATPAPRAACPGAGGSRHRHAHGRPRGDPGRPGAPRHRVPAGRPELGRAGRRPHESPLHRPLRPAPDPPPHRGGDGRRGALRHPRGRLPLVPPRARRGRLAASGSSSRMRAAVCFAP